MDGFELNKTLAALLIALLISLGAGMLGEAIIHPKMLESNAYPIEGVELAAEGADGAEEAKELAPIEPLLASANAEAGKVIAKKCLQCHTFEKGEPNKIGPNLWNILHSKIGHAADFAYSEALKAVGGNWDAETLNKFIHKPRDFIKGTKMSFAGIKSAKERADLIAYLKTLS